MSVKTYEKKSDIRGSVWIGIFFMLHVLATVFAVDFVIGFDAITGAESASSLLLKLISVVFFVSWASFQVFKRLDGKIAPYGVIKQ